jgi:hypothetical protein
LLSVYSEDFNAGTGGWVADGEVYRTSGGVNNSGYLEGHRIGITPNFNPYSGTAAANALGNLEALYGSDIRISYYGRLFSSQLGNQPPREGFYSSDFSTLWIKPVASSVEPFKAAWTQVSFEINTNWTDAQAEANGWQTQFGTTSWSATLHDLAWQEVFYALQFPSAGSTEIVSGIDNFRTESVLPDLAATSLTWDAAHGGVDFAYQVNGAALPEDTTAALYWASGTTEDTILEPVASPITIPSSTPVGVTQAVRIAVQDLSRSPPTDAKYLLLVVNPSGPSHVHEADEANDTNNLIALGIPLEIQSFQQTTYDLIADPDPAMPAITAIAKLVNLDSDPTATTTFHWQAKIEFDASTAPNGPNRQINYDYPVQEITGTGEYMPNFRNAEGTQVIRGGDLMFDLSAQIAGIEFEVKSDKLTVRGENPSEDNVRSFIRQQADAQGVGAYADDLGRIARQEGGGVYRQFLDNLPYFSEDNKGGAGIYQLTDPAPTPGQIWNWQLNVAEGVTLFTKKVTAARNYPARLERSVGFRNLVMQLNRQRVSHHLAPLIMTVPTFTAEQLRLDAIRGFNGYGGTDLGLSLHEYRVARDSQGRLIVQIIPGTNRAVAIWERVPVADRPQKFGDPDYVNHVLSRSP